MRECGSGPRRAIVLIPKVHGCDKTRVHLEYVKNLTVPQNLFLKVLYELMHLDANLASFFLGDFQWFDMAVKLAPLSSPIGADLILSDNLAALRSFGPAHIFGHQCQCIFDIPPVECGIRLFNKSLCVCHPTSYCAWYIRCSYLILIHGRRSITASL